MELSPGELRVILTLLYKEYHSDGKYSDEFLRSLAANSSNKDPKSFLSKLIEKLEEEYENS
jgi:hypothetical protein